MKVIMAQSGESLHESSCLRRRRRKVLNVTIIAFGAKAVRDFCLVICRIIAHKITYVPITLYFETDSNPLKFCSII